MDHRAHFQWLQFFMHVKNNFLVTFTGGMGSPSKCNKRNLKSLKICSANMERNPGSHVAIKSAIKYSGLQLINSNHQIRLMWDSVKGSNISPKYCMTE